MMKIIPKSAADFGITCTGSELEGLNRRFMDFYTNEKDENMTAKGQRKFWVIEILCFAINLYIAYDSGRSASDPYLTAAAALLPVIILALFIYACFTKDDILKGKMRILTASIQGLLVVSVSFAAIASDSFSDFLLPFANMVIGMAAGAMTWGKVQMANYAAADKASAGRTKLISSIGAIISVAVVPVIRTLLKLLSEPAAHFIGMAALMLDCGLIGCLIGMSFKSILYYIFLKKQKYPLR